jgi:error-prone DNA polymerase
LTTSFKDAATDYRIALGDKLSIAATRTYGGNDAKMLARIYQLATELKIPMVATNDVHYHHFLRRELQDVVTCVREKCTIHTAGFNLASECRTVPETQRRNASLVPAVSRCYP